MKNKHYMILLMMLAGWMNRQQQGAIEYLKEENEILKHELLKATGKECILLSNQQRRSLVVLGKKLGRKVISEICYAFSPDTILKWHRRLVAQNMMVQRIEVNSEKRFKFFVVV